MSFDESLHANTLSVYCMTDSIAQKTIRKKQSRQVHITSQAVGMEIFAAFPHHAIGRQFDLRSTAIRRNLQ
jgi:hypothetical protein